MSAPIAPSAAGTEKARIVVGVDGSEESKQALRWAADESRCTGAEIDAVIAWEIPTGYGWGAVLPADYDPVLDARRALEDTIDEVLGRERDVVVHAIVEEGQPATVLLQLAKGARELVVGSRGHGGFAGLLLGSTSTQCMHHATCPVVVVRAE